MVCDHCYKDCDAYICHECKMNIINKKIQNIFFEEKQCFKMDNKKK